MNIAIVLAAGESSRMVSSTGERQLKQLLPFGKTTIIESILSTILSSSIEQTIVVLGYQADIIQNQILKFPITTVLNRDYPKGMLTSIQAGIRQAMEIFESKVTAHHAIFIFLGDQPLVSKNIIDEILLPSSKAPDSILIPTYHGKRGHPILIPEKYIDEILRIPPEKGLRELMLHHPQEIIEVPVQQESILLDMDTLEEYQEIRKREV